ncbi:M13 family metallopeptidase [Loigolactobacillus backii]|uniref:Peptidase M13 n=1 Tax=Loigolactobacillus backii TaxID=375175 RepID=A0A192H0B9_9LACO|nr:M13-type metalloendopeptidase [Loigolactobacillus backii]ANK62234.1 peptidase M13 [Loigolactobacillus backii]ANK70751.1 peptidase M13 [Loigolactobacillus backii]MDA5387644.1 M13 family peptidase [Loigolactobacillus backii]MDA5390199.1 M13 family peptidase [Loigolactobacillus backii]PIO82664.1 peptidase M13 [Loigolactobacillus backii]
MTQDKTTTNTATPTLKDDFYEAINADWLKTATIPADKPATGGFQDLVDEIDKTLMADFKQMNAGQLTVPNEQLASFLAYYRLAADFTKRDQDGAAPLKTILAQVTNLTSLKDWQNNLAEWILSGLPTPFDIDVDADMKNTKINTLFASAPNLILPDKTYYAKDNQAGPQLLQVFSQMMTKLFTLAGYQTADAEKIISEALAFDKSLAPHVKSAEESADYSKMYNPQDFSTFTANSHSLDLGSLIKQLVKGTPTQIIVTEPKFYAAFDEMINDTTFPLLKSWLLVQTIRGFSSYLSEDFRQTAGIYGRALSGSKEATKQQKSAYYLASGQFDQVVGLYYGHKYFGATAKQDVHDMVTKMISVYKQRLTNNNWLSKATREKAVVKLNNLGIQVGYPDQLDPLYKLFKTKTAAQGGTLLENTLNFVRISQQDRFAKWQQPVDRDKWEMSAATVNAYYHPFRNIIVFPAAILQAPFYSLDQPSSANYGGIGAVIAHEISHAFDNNGALFDEFGNLHNWWTKADSAQFKEKAQAMITEFAGLPFAGQQVNGKLTVSENIADAGGLSCALEAAKGESDVDLSVFFTNWATIWRTKAQPEYQQLLLAIDVHAPAKLRANVQIQNLDDFFTTFDVKQGDGMYLATEKRVHIW